MKSSVDLNPDGGVISKKQHMLAIMILKCNGFISLQWARKKICTTGFSLRIFFNGTLALQKRAFPQRKPADRAWLHKREA